PHNQFLKILGEQGLIGLAAFLFFIYRALTCRSPSPYREIAAAVLIAWCMTSLANSHFSTFVEGRFIFFWLGAMLATPSNGIATTAGMGSGGPQLTNAAAAIEDNCRPRPQT